MTLIEQRQIENLCCKLYATHLNIQKNSVPASDTSSLSAEQTIGASESDDTDWQQYYNEVIHYVQEMHAQEFDNKIELHRLAHRSCLKQCLEKPFSAVMIALDASKAWIVFWILQSLDMLNASEDYQEYQDKIRNFILTLWDEKLGGFSGGNRMLSHVASTYAAVMALLINGDERSYSIIDRQGLHRFFLSLRDPVTKGIRAHTDGEIDMRSCYCAVATASLLHMITDELFADVEQYILSCVTYEGGIAGEPGCEAHGGYTYCGLATMCILGKAHLLNLERMLSWACSRQKTFEGGFEGRPNKLVDSCYSFWLGATICLLRIYLSENSNVKLDKELQFFSTRALQLYVLINCQGDSGGFRDKPGVSTDMYHTAYSLSGLSIAQHGHNFPCKQKPHQISNTTKPHTIGSKENVVAITHPLYNLRLDKVAAARKYFSTNVFVEEESNKRGVEGVGVF